MRKGRLLGRLFEIALVFVMIGAVLGAPPASVNKVEASPATIYVPDSYPTIQAAVDAAVAGDTITVRGGIYQEHVTLYKSLILQTDEGATIDGGGSLSTVTITAETCTVSGFNITGSGSHPNENAGIRIDSNGNNISGNTIRGNKCDGILLHDSYYNTIINNFISDNEASGIYAGWTHENTIEGNTISDNGGYGLHLGGGYNILSGNTISGNGDYGLFLPEGYNNILRDNVMSGNYRNFGVSYPEYNDVDTSNTVDGRPIYYLVGVEDALIDSASNAGYVLVVNSQNVTVRDLALTNNDKGVWLHDCYGCLVDNITAQDNDYGIYLQEASYCTVQNCTISGNGQGIYLSSSIGNVITGNIIQASEGTGIALYSSDGNFLTGNIVRDNRSGIRVSSSYDCRIEHNLVARNEYDGISIEGGRGHLVYGNTIYQNGRYGIRLWWGGAENNDINHNNFIDNGGNAETWYGEQTNSWDDGTEGNYWSDYEERYPDAQEVDETGIWDTPYEIPGDAGDKDNYPLVEPFETVIPIPNQPPDQPGNPSPADDAIGVSINADLSWTGGDPNPTDTVTYDIYLGTNATPPFKETIGPYPAMQYSVTYDPGPLDGATTYYWKIIATDSSNVSAEGPVWDFTTATIIYVPDDYPTIQAAVDAAVAGDAIVVRAGTYQEHVTLYKSLTLQTYEGATIDGGGSLSTVTVTANGCTVSGFNITGSGSHPNENAGLRIDSSYNTISGNDILGNKCDGILLHDSYHNTITNNLISDNEGSGIYAGWTHENTIEGNTISDNGGHGLRLGGSNNILSGNTIPGNGNCGLSLEGWNNILSGNLISDNGDYGLYLGGSDSTLRTNVMTGNDRNFAASYPHGNNDVDTSNTVDGKPIYYLVGVEDALIDSASNAGYVLVVDSQNITIRDLTLANNDKGVWLYGCYGCLVDNVTAQDNDYGIYLQESSYCTVQNCTISGNGQGIYLGSSIGNVITDNIIDTSEDTGIALYSSDGNFLTGNAVRDNQYGIRLEYSYDCRIEHNLVARNQYDGISVGGDGHLIYGNTISQNGYYGITLGGEGNDLHHNNFVDNGENARSWSSEGSNSWDDGSEGNYWSDYEERYPDAEEIDGTGIWDTPYGIPYDTGDKDNYPLVEPFDTLIPNQPPDQPDNPSPTDDATGISINADLSWAGGDPDPADTVTYDIYFGTNATPALNETIGPYPATQSSITYDPGPLAGDTTYYWKIIATDSHNISTEGPLWDFITQPSTPGITVTSPNGGENWTVGSMQTITWTSFEVTGDVRIGISRNGGSSWSDFIIDTANDGSASWIVTGPATAQARIRVMSASDGGIWDMTDENFVIDIEVWAVPMVADAGVEGSNPNLEFGIHPDATDGYDSDIDLPQPPPPPPDPEPALFEAYFSIVDAQFPKLNKDFRGAMPNEWTLKVNSTYQDIELTWDASNIPSDLCARMDTGIEKIDMRAQSSVVLAAGEYTIRISVSEQIEIQLPLKAGWNMISLPVDPGTTNSSLTLPDVEVLYTWNCESKSYASPSEILPGTGYWALVFEDVTETINGTPVEEYQLGGLCEGWHMIGGLSVEAEVIEYSGDVYGSLYHWDPGTLSYIARPLGNVMPGEGYWLLAFTDFSISLNPKQSVP